MLTSLLSLVWFSVSLGATEKETLDFWQAPHPTPLQWEQAVLKTPNNKPIGVYYRGKFGQGGQGLTPNQVEYVFETGRLVSATYYFAEIDASEGQKLFNQWQTETFRGRTKEPSAVQKAADRVSTYFVSQDETWKWVVNGSDITIRRSSNSRLPTALAEAIALGANVPAKSILDVVRRYAYVHRRLIEGKTEIERVRALIEDKATPPLMASDLRLVLAMMLSAAFRNTATHPTAPDCQTKLLDEAKLLAPQLARQMDQLKRLCRAK
ncbi:MAG: hypothetical protein ACPGQS_00580 [Bradymonadia bacterium]